MTPSNPANVESVNMARSLRYISLAEGKMGQLHSEKTKETLYELAWSPRTWIAVGIESCR